MASIRRHEGKGTLFLDFRHASQRLREYTSLADTPANRKRLNKVLERIETEMALGVFDYEKTFGKPLPKPVDATVSDAVKPTEDQHLVVFGKSNTPTFSEFANLWFAETEVSWRRSYVITQRGALDKYLITHFGDRAVGSITKADVLAFRASLAKVTTRNGQATLSLSLIHI